MTAFARVLAVMAAAAAVAGLSACGGEPRRAPVRELATPAVSEPPGTARVTDPVRARYVRRVDAVCARYNPQREGALVEAERAPDERGAVKAFDTSISLAQEQLRSMALFDPLTQLANRAFFHEQFHQAVAMRKDGRVQTV
ncbi:MAG: hypothetical protein ACXVRM_13475, partial [Solirubrobacteraceae bacterium]